MRLHIKALVPLRPARAFLLSLVGLVGACDGCEEPRECPSDFVYANGEPVELGSGWNHAQLSSRGEHDTFHTMLPRADGAVVMATTLDAGAYLVQHTAAGVQLDSTTQVSDFSPVVPVAIGPDLDHDSVFAVTHGVWVEDDIPSISITSSRLGTEFVNDFRYEYRIALNQDLEEDETLLDEIPTSAVFGDNHMYIAGVIQTSLDGDVRNTPFLTSVSYEALEAQDSVGFPVPHGPVQTWPAAARNDATVMNLLEGPGNTLFLLRTGAEGTNLGATLEQVTLSTEGTVAPDALAVTWWSEAAAQTTPTIRAKRTADGVALVDNDSGGPRVRAYRADATLAWDTSLESEQARQVNDIAPVGEGQLIAVGTETEGDIRRVFMVALDAATGAENWRAEYDPGAMAGNFITAKSVVADNDTGSFWIAGDTNFQHNTLRSYGGDEDAYVHRFDSQGREWGFRGIYCEAWLDEYGVGNPDDPIQ